MKFNPHPYQIQEYHAEGQRGRYIVINPEGFDFVGEHMPYKEAVSIVRHEKLLLRATNNMRLLKLVAQLLTVGDVVNSLHDKTECQEWIQSVLFWANDKEIREIIRKPSMLHEFLANQAKQEAINSKTIEKKNFIYNSIDVEYMKLYVANRLEIEYLSLANVQHIVSEVLTHNDIDNLRIVATDKSFMHECCDLVISEFENEQKTPIT